MALLWECLLDCIWVEIWPMSSSQAQERVRVKGQCSFKEQMHMQNSGTAHHVRHWREASVAGMSREHIVGFGGDEVQLVIWAQKMNPRPTSLLPLLCNKACPNSVAESSQHLSLTHLWGSAELDRMWLHCPVGLPGLQGGFPPVPVGWLLCSSIS